MKTLIIEPTEFSPSVLFDANNNKFKISGDSRPENAGKFYKPVIDWLEKYYSLRYWKDKRFDTKSAPVVFEFQLEYFNSTSAKFILDILKKIDEFRREKMHIVVKWYYDGPDTDMKESGEEFSKMAGFPFELIKLET